MGQFQLAFRALTRNPAPNLFILALLGISLGIATTLFTLFDAVLLRPLPVPHPDQLVRLVQHMPKLPPRSNFSYGYYKALHDHASSLQFIFGETDDGIHLRMTSPAPAELVTVRAVTPDFFLALGAKPYWGRILTPADDAQTSGLPPAVLSYNFWRKHFPENPGNLRGKTVLVNGHPVAIVGVMPGTFNGISADYSPDLRVPLSACPVLLDCKPENVDLELAARLKPATHPASAEAECLAIWNSTMRDYYLNIDKAPPAVAAAYLKRGVNLEPLAQGTSLLRNRIGDALKLVMAAVLLLMLIIGLNVAGLLLARTLARRQELAVKLAIGATRRALVLQMAVESLLLGTTAAIIAFCVASVTTPLSLRMLPPVRSVNTDLVPLSLNVAIDWRVFLFLLLGAALTTLLFTISPALAVLRLNVDSVLRTARSSAGLRKRQLLIALQIALCTFLLVSATQLARSFQRLAATPSGFAHDSIATFTCDLDEYKNAPVFLQALKDRVLQLPGVVSVATSSAGVMREHGLFASVALAGQRVGRSEFMGTNGNQVSPGYFSTMGVRLITGRDLTPSDTQKKNQLTFAVVNQSFVHRFFGTANPLGQRFGAAAEGTVAQPQYEIVGVVSDTRYRSLKDPIRPMYFTAQDDFESFVLNVRTTGRPEAIIGPVRQAAASIAPDLPFLEASTLSREIDQTTAPERTIAILSSLFALAAAGIAAIGTYGLLLYSVRQRRLEIGIRMAIGAQQTDIIKLIARQMFGMTIAGLTLGLVAALTTKPDAQSLTTALLFVGFFAITAAIPPALQAIRIQPADSLRSPNL